MEEMTSEGKKKFSIEIGNEKGDMWIVDMKILKMGRSPELINLEKLMAKPTRLCGCGGVCLAKEM